MNVDREGRTTHSSRLQANAPTLEIPGVAKRTANLINATRIVKECGGDPLDTQRIARHQDGLCIVAL